MGPVDETGFRRKKYAVYVWRSVRGDGATKTEKSRRTLEIPDDVAKALKEHHADNWTPRELRHSFVSIMSDNGVTIEQIADLVGQRTTVVTQKVYRHQLKPVISTGATAMNTIFGNKKTA